MVCKTQRAGLCENSLYPHRKYDQGGRLCESNYSSKIKTVLAVENKIGICITSNLLYFGCHTLVLSNHIVNLALVKMDLAGS